VKNIDWIKELRTYTIITLSLMIGAIGWTGFIIPSNIVGGGVMGIASIVYYILGWSAGPVYLVINILLIGIAIKILGRGFGLKTIYSMVVFSLLISLFQHYITEPIVKEKFMAAIVGGGLSGISIGLLLMHGGSTGGTEIVAMLINKYRHVSPGRVMMFCDVIIIGSSYILFQSIETVVYGYVVMGVVSYVADMLLTGSKQSVQIFIVSEKPREVADAITRKLHRGLSLLNGKGYYTKKDREFIMMIVRKSESHTVFQMIKEVDPDAFVSVANVMGVYGLGFDKYRPPLKKSKT
jgi:uncharacterized membrane-anchored protein YitT (DUF2179 family)